MRVEVNQIPPQGLQVAERLSSEWAVAQLEGEASVGPDGVEVHLSVQPVGKQFVLQGSLRAVLSYECHRCLDETSEPVHAAFTLMCGPPPAEASDDQEEVELLEEDLDYLSFSGPELLIDDVIREQLLLALPMVRHCGPDCRGLCPSCGCNRNRERCTCEEPPVDPRWAALQALRNKSS